jgi:hypothetical protein
MAPHDRVVFIDENFYDVPFYARLARPVVIASDWSDPDVPKRDNWRKELFDATRFDPLRARELLWPIGRLAELSCGVPAVWFVIPAGRDAAVQGVPGSARVYADARTQLWRAAGRTC